MLAGLLLALHDADDRPGALTATLPFGGVTLIEYQARLLIAAGASQIVVVVARQTPELLGALSRIGRRGVAVDTVRTAADIAEKMHPLARIVMLADGLTTSAAAVATMATEGGDALLVLPDAESTRGFERIGGGMNWAGVARIDPRRLGELAALPRDYDIQSTLVRLASQAGAGHVMLAADALRQGHGIEHSATLMEVRGHIVLAAVVSTRRGWFDRAIVNPIARLAIVPLVTRMVPALAVAAGSVVLAVVGLAALWFDHPASGLIATIAAGIGLAIAAMLDDLRDDAAAARASGVVAQVLPGVAVLLAGYRQSIVVADGAAIAIAVALVVAVALKERAAIAAPAAWWGTPPAYLFVVLIGAIPGFTTMGLIAATIYAAVTLLAVIDRFREQP